ncbi:hypothetical protein DW253_01230 [Ruminococcus sp. AM22-13]|nr:hypothetical protein DW253_01230 [Ruminococcus sp. AM22-13]
MFINIMAKACRKQSLPERNLIRRTCFGYIMPKFLKNSSVRAIFVNKITNEKEADTYCYLSGKLIQ